MTAPSHSVVFHTFHQFSLALFLFFFVIFFSVRKESCMTAYRERSKTCGETRNLQQDLIVTREIFHKMMARQVCNMTNF